MVFLLSDDIAKTGSFELNIQGTMKNSIPLSLKHVLIYWTHFIQAEISVFKINTMSLDRSIKYAIL